MYACEFFAYFCKLFPVWIFISRESHEVAVYSLISGNSYSLDWQDCGLYSGIVHYFLNLWRQFLEVFSIWFRCTDNTYSNTRTRERISYYHIFSESQLSSYRSDTILHLRYEWFDDSFLSKEFYHFLGSIMVGFYFLCITTCICCSTFLDICTESSLCQEEVITKLEPRTYCITHMHKCITDNHALDFRIRHISELRSLLSIDYCCCIQELFLGIDNMYLESCCIFEIFSYLFDFTLTHESIVDKYREYLFRS